MLNGYVASPSILESLDSYIVAPGLEDNAGLYGALALGIEALDFCCSTDDRVRPDINRLPMIGVTNPAARFYL